MPGNTGWLRSPCTCFPSRKQTKAIGIGGRRRDTAAGEGKQTAWWTPDGERILQGAEGQLFREALGMIVDMVRDDAEGLWQ